VCLVATDLSALIVWFGAVGAGFGLVQPGLVAGAILATGTNKQGLVAGHMRAAMSAAWIIGPIAGTAVYAASIEGPSLLAAAVTFVGTLVNCALMPIVCRSQRIE
jgi:hypothetical protein